MNGSSQFADSAFLGMICSDYLCPYHTEIALIFAICDCDAHRGPQKSLAISETKESDAALRFQGAMESRWRFAISGCDFWARNLFLRDFWRFGSVNADIASDCNFAILVR